MTCQPILVETGDTEGCSGWGFNGDELADSGVAVVAVGVCEGCASGAWMASNLALGGAKVESGVEVCLFTLAHWQLRHALVHCLTSCLMLGQTNQAV